MRRIARRSLAAARVSSLMDVHRLPLLSGMCRVIQIGLPKSVGMERSTQQLPSAEQHAGDSADAALRVGVSGDRRVPARAGVWKSPATTSRMVLRARSHGPALRPDE